MAKRNTHTTEAEQITDKLTGANLRRLRKSFGLSQQVLGEIAGITFQQIQKYEHGSNRISCSRLLTLASAMSIATGQRVTPGAIFAGAIPDGDYTHEIAATTPIITDEQRRLLGIFGDLNPKLRGNVLALLQTLADSGEKIEVRNALETFRLNPPLGNEAERTAAE